MRTFAGSSCGFDTGRDLAAPRRFVTGAKPRRRLLPVPRFTGHDTSVVDIPGQVNARGRGFAPHLGDLPRRVTVEVGPFCRGIGDTLGRGHLEPVRRGRGQVRSCRLRRAASEGSSSSDGRYEDEGCPFHASNNTPPS